MTIQELEKKIKEIASIKQIHEQEIINNILVHLEVIYTSRNHSNEDKALIEEIKNKIGAVLYSCDRQRMGINQMTKYDVVFNLDQVEMKLVEEAWKELEAQGYVYSLKYEIGLKEEGIRKYR